MKTYPWILFDADETLFRFDSFRGLKILFAQYDIVFTEKDYQDYQLRNKSLWADYQSGKITAQHIHKRFDPWAEKLEVSIDKLNRNFLATMTDICEPLPGALNLLKNLKGKSRFGIITNGFNEFQQTRLEKTGVHEYIEFVVVSEDVGLAKPHPAIFDHAIRKMNNPPRENILMVGDTLESDILGGLNSGLDTCWINRENKIAPEHINPKYQINSLMELEHLLNQ